VRVAVTGGTGFVGRHVVALLARRGHAVRILARRPDRAQRLAGREAEVVAGDLSDSVALRRLLQRSDAAVHLVAIIVESGAQTFAAVHVDGTRRLLEAAVDAGVRRLVHMSAVGARADPRATRYHRTKWQAEELARSAGIPAAIFRPSLISGPESVPIRTLARLHRWSPAVPVFGNGTFPTQPVWVEDVALACALAVEQPELVGTFELGGPVPLTFDEFVRTIGQAAGHPRPLLHLPLPLARLVAHLCDPLRRAAPITSDQLQMLVEGSATPANAIERVFGIAPLGFEEGLKRFL